MWFSRIWAALLALGVAAALVVALVAPRPAARELAQTNRQNLDRTQHNAELLLKLEARGWIDTVTSFANDATLLRVMEQATGKAADISTLQGRASSALMALASRIKPGDRPELMIAVDLQGKQVCRIGPGDQRYKPGVDGLAGYPVVEAALRGFQLDDSWSIDGKLYLVTAAPLISRSQARYVGALVIGQRVDDAFASKLKALLAGDDTHVAFFLRGAVVATTIKHEALKKLPIQYENLRPQVDRHGRSKAVTLEGQRRYMAVMAAVPGEASFHDAFYAVIAPPPATAATLGSALGRASAKEDMQGFPWVLVIGIFVALTVIGLAVQFVEAHRPLGRLLAALQKVNRGDATRIEPRVHSGGLRDVAIVVNDLLDKQDRRQPASSVAGKDLNQTFGGPGNVATRPDLRVGDALPPLADAMPPLAADDSIHESIQPLSALSENYPRVADSGDDALPLPVPPPGLRRGRDHEREDGIRRLPGIEAEDSPTMVDERQPMDLPLRPISLEDSGVPPPSEDEELLGPTAARSSESRGAAVLDPIELFDPGGHSFGASAEPAEEPSSLKVRVSSSAPDPPGPTAPSPEVSGIETVMSSVPEMMARKVEDQEEDGQFRRIFEDFLTIKKQCGESIENVTFDRFAAKLRKNRSALMSRYACRDVSFQVYVKDGKAALKATPVKNGN